MLFFSAMQGLNPVTTPVRASVQTGEAPNLGHKADLQAQVGLTPEVGGFARLNHWLTQVVTLRLRRLGADH